MIGNVVVVTNECDTSKKGQTLLPPQDSLLTFMTQMSLELRTPLNSIIGYGEMLQEDMQSSQPQDKNNSYVLKIIDSAKYLLDMTNNVSDLSKIENGKMDLYLEDVLLDTLLNDLQLMVSSALSKSNKTFTIIYNTSENDQIKMHTDPIRVKYSLFNFITNIAKMTHQNSIELEVQPIVDNSRQIKFALKNISNKISTEQLEKFFRTFSQNANFAHQYGAIGLSLYLARRFAEILGGGITVESHNNDTAVFSMIIPTHTTSTFTEGIKATFSEVSSYNEKTVLIIDSSPATHRELQSMLGKEQFSVLHAFNCDEGIKLARLNKPGVIVLDIPELMTLDMSAPLALDGWAALSALKSEPTIAKIPTIVMSNVSENNLGFTLGAVDYIGKPVNISLLSEKIKHFTPAKK